MRRGWEEVTLDDIARTQSNMNLTHIQVRSQEMTITNPHPHEHHDVVVIGAGPAGLAPAAPLSRGGVEALVVDRGEQVGTSWRGHYDRLHLHTARRFSHLPG